MFALPQPVGALAITRWLHMQRICSQVSRFGCKVPSFGFGSGGGLQFPPGVRLCRVNGWTVMFLLADFKRAITTLLPPLAAPALARQCAWHERPARRRP